MYKPIFSTSIRGGKTAIWVKMPNDEQWNIWDINSQLAKDETIRRLVTWAFERGMQARAMQERQLEIYLDCDFIEEDVN